MEGSASSNKDTASINGAVGKFQRLAVEEQGAEGCRSYSRNPSSDGYLNPPLSDPSGSKGLRTKRKSDEADFLQPYLDNQGGASSSGGIPRYRHSFNGGDLEPRSVGFADQPDADLPLDTSFRSLTARSRSEPMGQGVHYQDLCDTVVSEEVRVYFSEGTKSGTSLVKSTSIQRKGTPGVSLMANLADVAAEVQDGTGCDPFDDDADMQPGTSVRFSEDTKSTPGLGPSPSIRRKGTPGVGLMSDLADIAAEVNESDERRGMQTPETVGGVRFSEGTKAGPSLGRAPSIQRKGTPGAGLMSNLADMAADIQGSGGDDPFAEDDNDMRTPVGGVRFSEDTKAGPSLGRAPSIQRKGTPGVGLMSNLADMAADIQGSGGDDPFAEDDDDDMHTPVGGVRFSEETKAGPSLGRAPSIQRKGTPGVGLMSNLADMAAEVQGSGGDSPFAEDDDDDMRTPVGGVRFSEGTKAGPSLGRAPSIQRKGTPGAGLMSNLADMAAEVQGSGGDSPFAADEDDMRTPVGGVRFSEGTKAGPSLGRAPSIQRKGTPGAGLMSNLADMAADIQGSGGDDPFAEDDDDDMHTPVGGVRFSEETKAGPSLGRAPSIQRKGTPGVGLMSNLADMAAEVQGSGGDDPFAEDDDDDMHTPVGGVRFSEGTKAGPSLGRAPSIQRKGTPGIGLMSNLADMAVEVQGSGGDCPFVDADDDMRTPVGGVRFSEGTNAGPSLGRAPSIQRKGTPGAGLMSNLADMAAEVQGSGGDSPFAADEDDMRTPVGGVRFSEGTKAGPSLGRAPSIQRKGTPGAGLMSNLADMAADIQGSGGDDPFAEDDDDDMHTPVGGVRFSEETKAGPSLGRAPSIQRKGTPGVGLMSNLADMAAEVQGSGGDDPFAEDDDDDMHTPVGGVRFSEGTKAGPSLGRAPSIQRKGTPGIGLMSNLADMAVEVQGSGGDCPFVDADDDMRTPVGGVRFSEGTNAGPSLGRAPSIQRKGTPGAGLMSNLSDMAADIQGSGGDDPFAEDDDDDMRTPVGGVRFSEGTKAGPSLGRAPSIQRKGTPGVGLMSNLADIAAEVQGSGGDDTFAEDDDDDMHTPVGGVRFSEGTKAGPSLGRAPSIQRKGTPGVGLMSNLADMAAEVQGSGGDDPFAEDDDMHTPVGGVRFSEGTKAGPSLGPAPSIQRKGTPGIGLMCNLADMAAEIQGSGGGGPFAADDDDDMSSPVGGVRFSEGTKAGPSLGRAPSIQRKGTPGAGLMSNLADMAADIQGSGGDDPFAEDDDDDMRTPVGGVRFSEGTKAGPSLGRAPSIQRKGTPGVGLMSNLADMAAEVQGSGGDYPFAEDDDDDMHTPVGGVRFSEGTKAGPSLGRAPSIQRKGTPGAGLMSNLADIASDLNDNSGGADSEMSTGAVRFSEDTKAGPSLGRVPTIQRKGTPGCGLMSSLADIASEINDGTNNDPFADDDTDNAPRGGGVRFSEACMSTPTPERNPSIQRKSTPGTGLLASSSQIGSGATQLQGGMSSMPSLPVASTSYASQQPPRPPALSRRASTTSADYPSKPSMGPAMRTRSHNSATGQAAYMPDLSRQLRKASSEVSAIFKSMPPPAASGSTSSGDTATVKLVTPEARFGRVSFTSDDGVDFDMTPEPLSRPQPQHVTSSRAEPAGHQPEAGPSQDVNMEGLTAAMAELGPRPMMQ